MGHSSEPLSVDGLRADCTGPESTLPLFDALFSSVISAAVIIANSIHPFMGLGVSVYVMGSGAFTTQLGHRICNVGLLRVESMGG